MTTLIETYIDKLMKKLNSKTGIIARRWQNIYKYKCVSGLDTADDS
jgi:hypothetical protein